jgi:sodium transport system permease protein
MLPQSQPVDAIAMKNEAILERGADGPGWSDRGEILARLVRLSAKELRETLRDRRTIVTLFVMPLILYPLLALVFQRFLLTSLPAEGTVEYVVGVESARTWERLARQLQQGDMVLRQERMAEESVPVLGKPDTGKGARSPFGTTAARDEDRPQPTIVAVVLPKGFAERHVIDATVHLAIVRDRGAGDADDGDGLDRPSSWQVYYRSGSLTSEAAARYVQTRLRAFSESRLDQQLKNLGVSAALPADTTLRALDYSGAPVFSLAALIPLILVLMTVTGAVYPAIDLTAGERERGTLEMLIAAPVPRVGLLLAKYVAVLAVAILTATVNLIGMAITANMTGLNLTLFGGGGMSLPVVIKVLLLLVLFAAFFSAVLLAITSYARSFKEAQAYIIPLMLLCLVPGIVCLMPSLQFTGLLAVVPLVNIVLLARDLLEGSVDPVLATAAVVSTAFYVVAAIALAARIFGTDAVLYGSQSTWSDLFRRPQVPRDAASTSMAACALAAMFPGYFVLSNMLAHGTQMSLDRRFLVAALVTAVVFGAIPYVVAAYNRVRLASGFGLARPGWLAIVAAAILGLALWPAAHELFLLGRWMGFTALDASRVEVVRKSLDEWRELSPAWILLTLALVPGVFEELFFRGFLYSALRTVLTPWRTIAVAALLFAAFHVVAGTMLAPERFLPSLFLGLVLGWVRHRTGSVVPCMVLHTLHNGLLLAVVYWQEELAARGIGVEEAEHLPLVWLAASAVAVIVAILLMQFTRSASR